MSNPLDPVRIALNKAVEPNRKGRMLVGDLKEADLSKDPQPQTVKKYVQGGTERVENKVGAMVT
jgi:hypothetical protein